MTKKILIILLAILSLIPIIFSQESLNVKYLEVKGGFMIPWGTGFGFRGGVQGGFYFDQMVSINANIDYYRATYTTEAEESTSPIDTRKINSKTTANLFLLIIGARIDIPYIIADIIQPYAQIGVGYDWLYNIYEKTSGQQNYLFIGDFLLFQLEIGAQLKLGERTYAFLNLGYTFSGVTKSKNPEETLIVGEKIDVSGFYSQIGIGFKL